MYSSLPLNPRVANVHLPKTAETDTVAAVKVGGVVHWVGSLAFLEPTPDQRDDLVNLGQTLATVPEGWRPAVGTSFCGVCTFGVQHQLNVCVHQDGRLLLYGDQAPAFEGTWVTDGRALHLGCLQYVVGGAPM